jgi:hypothetical protein
MRKLSPAQRHLQQKLTAMSIAKAKSSLIAVERPATGPEASAYALLRAQMGEDMRRLHDIQSTDLKIEAKHEMLPTYQDHIDTVLLTSEETGKAVQDEVFVQLMIWHFDCGLFDRALDMAEHVLRFGLKLPERFRRTAAVAVVDMVADAALSAIEQNQSFDIEVIRRTGSLTSAYDVVNEAKAKLHKAAGILFMGLAEKAAENTDGPAGAVPAAQEEALRHLREVLRLGGSGVTTRIKSLESALTKSAL